MIGGIVALIGLIGLLFVACLRIHDSFRKKYIVRWIDINGDDSCNCWTLVSACTEWGAIRIVQRTEVGVKTIIKVVKQND